MHFRHFFWIDLMEPLTPPVNSQFL